MQQRQSEILAAKAHVLTVNGNRLPSLVLQDQLNMGTNNGLQGGYFSLGIVPSTAGSNSSLPTHTNPNPGNVAIGFLQWEVFNFGYYRAQQKQANSQLAVIEANLAGDKYQLTEQIISLYLDWLKKFRLLQIKKENMQRAQLIFSVIRANVLSGLKPGVDSSTANAVYSDSRITYLQGLEDYNYVKILIASYAGLKAADIIPDTTFYANIPQLITTTGDSLSETNPMIEVYSKLYELQLADNKTTAKKYLPKVGLDAATWERSSGISYSGTYPEQLASGFPYSRFNYLLGATLSYNLFDLKHRQDQLAEGRYLAEARQGSLQNQQLLINRLWLQTNSAYLTTVEKLNEMPLQLFSAQQALAQQMALYRSGLNTLIELTNSTYALSQAETNYVITQTELLQLIYIRAGLTGQLDNLLQKFKH